MADKDLISAVEGFIKGLPDYNSKIKLSVAYSGGVDSSVLLDIVLKLYMTGKISKPEVIYFNHNLRGKESEKEKKFVVSRVKLFDLKSSIIDLDVNTRSKEKNISIESAARELRYEYLEELSSNKDHILLAHHRDDNIETVFFNFLRGSGLNGLEGIKKIRGKYLRPLLNVSKEEIIHYAKENEVQFVEDRSNYKNEFSRNKIRNKIIPMIEKELKRNIKNSIFNLSNNISEVNEYFNKIVADILDDRDQAVCFNGKLVILNRKRFVKNDIVLQKLIINRVLNLLGMHYNPYNKTLAEILEHIKEQKDTILKMLDQKLEVAGNNIIMTGPGFRWDKLTKVVIDDDVRTQYYFDADKLAGGTTITSVDPDNNFIPFSKNKPEKIRKVLSDKKIPKIFREHLLAVCDSEKMIFIQGAGISDSVRTDENTTRINYISIENNYLDFLF